MTQVKDLIPNKEVEEALKKFEDRRQNAPEPVDNATLPAGSPMYFYCKFCGHESDVLSEGYTGVPKKICDECKPLVDKGWIQ